MCKKYLSAHKHLAKKILVVNYILLGRVIRLNVFLLKKTHEID